MVSMLGWLGGTLGAFIFGGICVGLAYLGFDLINERRLKRKKPQDMFSPELQNGKKEEIDERRQEDNERRKRTKFRIYEKLRGIANRIIKRERTTQRAVSSIAEGDGSSAGTPSDAERTILPDDVNRSNQGEYADDESGSEHLKEPDI